MQDYLPFSAVLKNPQNNLTAIETTATAFIRVVIDLGLRPNINMGAFATALLQLVKEHTRYNLVKVLSNFALFYRSVLFQYFTYQPKPFLGLWVKNIIEFQAND